MRNSRACSRSGYIYWTIARRYGISAPRQQGVAVNAAKGRAMIDTIRITKATTRKEKPKDSDLAFGTVFTDHMFLMDFEEEKGWYDPRIEPYGPIPLDPAAAILH